MYSPDRDNACFVSRAKAVENARGVSYPNQQFFVEVALFCKDHPSTSEKS